MSLKRWRGLKTLVQDAVEHGSRAVQKVHLATADRSFFVFEHLPEVGEPVKSIHKVHDLGVSTVYGSIRLVNAAVGKVLDVVIDEVERHEKEP